MIRDSARAADSCDSIELMMCSTSSLLRSLKAAEREGSLSSERGLQESSNEAQHFNTISMEILLYRLVDGDELLSRSRVFVPLANVARGQTR